MGRGLPTDNGEGRGLGGATGCRFRKLRSSSPPAGGGRAGSHAEPAVPCGDGCRSVTRIPVLKDVLSRTWRVTRQEEQSWRSTGWSLSRKGAAGALHSQLCAPVQHTAGRQQAPTACQALPQGPQLREHRRGAAGTPREPTAVRGKDATSSLTWRKLFPAVLKRSEAPADGLFEPKG